MAYFEEISSPPIHQEINIKYPLNTAHAHSSITSTVP